MPGRRRLLRLAEIDWRIKLASGSSLRNPAASTYPILSRPGLALVDLLRSHGWTAPPGAGAVRADRAGQLNWGSWPLRRFRQDLQPKPPERMTKALAAPGCDSIPKVAG